MEKISDMKDWISSSSCGEMKNFQVECKKLELLDWKTMPLRRKWQWVYLEGYWLSCAKQNLYHDDRIMRSWVVGTTKRRPVPLTTSMKEEGATCLGGWTLVFGEIWYKELWWSTITTWPSRDSWWVGNLRTGNDEAVRIYA